MVQTAYHAAFSTALGGLTQALGAVKKLPRYWIEHTDTWKRAPMAFWVHRQADNEYWHNAKLFDPPPPAPDGKLGYKVLCVETGGIVFRFTSKEQLRSCIEILSMKPLPSTRRLSALRGEAGPNSHWLSRLPVSAKSPKGRITVVEDLKAVEARFGT